MGYIARAQLASAVSNAGGLGIIETSSGDLDAVRVEIRKMRDLTDKPFGVNIAQLFVRDASIVDFVVENGVRFVTTSAGDPTKYTAILKDAGLTVFHVVPSLRGALKAVGAGVDGLVVEGNEGGGFKHPSGASTMVLLPLVCSKVDVPVIAAGGIVDGRSMAASFVLGAEGVQMGTRMLSAAESPVHDRYKQLVVDSTESDTVLLNRFAQPAFRVLRTPRSTELERRDRGLARRARRRPRPLFQGRPRRGVRLRGTGRRTHRHGAARRRHPVRHDHRAARGAGRCRTVVPRNCGAAALGSLGRLQSRGRGNNGQVGIHPRERGSAQGRPGRAARRDAVLRRPRVRRPCARRVRPVDRRARAPRAGRHVRGRRDARRARRLHGRQPRAARSAGIRDAAGRLQPARRSRAVSCGSSAT